MKRLSLVAVVGLLACSSSKPGSAPDELPRSHVVVANFTGEVDPANGTMNIRSESTPEGNSLGVRALVIPETTGVAVTNDGTMWRGDTGHCTNVGAASSGRPIKIELREAGYPTGGTKYLTGVYTEITTIGTGSEGCNSVAAPAGLSNTKGLWSYGTLGATSPRSATVPWAFSWNSGAAFTFSGRVIAVEASAFATPSGPATTEVMPLAPAYQGIANNGDNVVFNAYFEMVFVAQDGSQTPVTFDPMFLFGVAPDVAKSRIWVTTNLQGFAAFKVGYTSSAGTGAVMMDLAESVGVIVADPAASPKRAWFVSLGAGNVQSVVEDGGVLSIGTTITLPNAGVPQFLAFGPGGRLYVTSYATDRVYSYTTDGTLRDTFDTSTSCRGPAEISAGPDGKVWFSSRTDRSVCTVTPGGTVASRVAQVSAYAPNGLTVGPDGNVWVAVLGDLALGTGGYVARVTPGGNITEYPLELGNGLNPMGITSWGANLWVVAANTSTGLLRLYPGP